MKRTDTVVIGGGQAGLAMSRCLSDRGIDHVVLERGRVAERWRSERWDSLRLLTPNWQSRLPGWSYDGSDPDGYMTMPEVVDYLERYAASFEAPVLHETNVLGVERPDARYRVTTDRGVWSARNVVVATGYCDVPAVPPAGAAVPDDVVQLVPTRYRNPRQLPPGGVLVVGASASGVQIADGLRAAGREVTLAVGRHNRMPRCYRGKDILWWLDAMGLLDQSIDEVADAERSRHQPSFQLAGRPDRASVDLTSLERRGVRLAGRLVGVDRGKAFFGNDLAATAFAADAKLAGLLGRIDRFAAAFALDRELPDGEPIVPIRGANPPATLELGPHGAQTVIWATGFRRRYAWLKVPVFDAAGEVRHRAGVTASAGLYVLGLKFQRRRNSSFIDGVGDDAAELARHIANRLAHLDRASA